MMEWVGYWYYITQRPPAPGAMPKHGLIKFFEYEGRLFVPAIGRKAYGSLVYDRELTSDEISDYELVPVPENQWEKGGYINEV